MPKILAINGGKPVRTEPFPPHNTIGAEEKAAVNRVLDTGVLSRYIGAWGPEFYGGREVQAFEQEWAAYFGVKHAIAVNSCTTGLQTALGAAGIGPGDEVIVSPYTMSASATAPLWYGAIPVFADIEEYFCLDPKSVEERITEHTRAIVVVDLFGQPYDADAINAIAKKHNLIVIEDCAQAPGARYKDKFAGTLGDIGVYSLNFHKHIHTGEGGVIVTDNDELAERCRLIRNHAEAAVGAGGITDLTNMVGSNFRLTEIQAAIGRAQLAKLEELIAQRVRNCEYLNAAISGIPGICRTRTRPGSTHVYYQQALLFDEKAFGASRARFIEALKAELPTRGLAGHEGPLISAGYVKPLYLEPLFQKKVAIGRDGFPFTSPHYRGAVNYEKGICPVAERMHERELIIHELMRPPLSTQDLDDVARAFHKVYEHRSELV
ncbi:MAG: DegT/DnrJ/EryC1/StrS family aminotransferase [Candidatus Sungbacteria bacterium]|nr:DegT/DnrJ/EryC1/StrS family aminotransferase [Candidatus Sungbacteria bacterium]